MGKWLIMAFATLTLSYIYFLGQIVIHNCVHGTQFTRTRTNRIVGIILCSVQLVHFDGWRVAHLAHHRYTNTDRDPHRVDRPLLPYLATHYFRVAKAVWQPFRYLAAVIPPMTVAVGVIRWQYSAGHGMRGIAWTMLFWIIPIIASHLLVAHFNYVTHVGLPSGRGSDTRDFRHGIWRAVNAITFNFYLHADHHLRPSRLVPQYPEDGP